MTATPTVVIVSFWRNDAQRHLASRVSHLLAKVAPAGMRLRWLWAVGDSTDETAVHLVRYALKGGHGVGSARAVQVKHADTGLTGDDTPTRRRRLAATATQAFAALRETDDWVLLHESDLRTPDDIVGRFLWHPRAVYQNEAVAGWPTLDEGGIFYDQWAYRHLDGRHFTADEPKPVTDGAFEVASFGSCWLAPAALVRNRVLGPDCVVDLCRQWRSEGVHLWCDPTVTVVQPTDLWTPTAFD